LKQALSATELPFLAYWTVSGLARLGALNIPRAWIYAHYYQRLVVAWNWSQVPAVALKF